MRIWLFGLVTWVVLSSSSAWAQQEPGLRDLMQARSLAMGGAYRATGLTGDAVIGNPAAMTLQKRYEIDLLGAWDVQTKFGFAALTIMDSITSQVGAGVSYSFVSLGRGEENRVAHQTTLAVSVPIGDVVHIGLSGHHLLESGARTANALTVDAGLILRFSSLSLGFSGHNLIDVRNPDMTRYFVVSAAWLAGAFNVAADAHGDFGVAERMLFAANVGAEYIIGDVVPLRAGYSYDGIRGGQFLSFGAGFAQQGSGLDLAYRHELGGRNGRMLSLSVRVGL